MSYVYKVCIVLPLVFFAAIAFGDDQTFFDGLALEEKGDEKAYEIFSALAAFDEPLADHASYKCIARNYQNGEFSALIGPARDHIKRFPHSRFTPVIRLIYVEALCQRSEYGIAYQEVIDFRKDHPAMFQSRVSALMGMALGGLGRYENAARELGRAGYLYPDKVWSKRARDIAAKLKSQGHPNIIPPSKEEISTLLDKAIFDGHYWTCESLARTHTNLYGGWKERLKEVDCLLSRRKSRDARNLLKSIENKFPKSRAAQGGLMLRYAMAERGRDFKGKARTSYSKVMAEYPNTEASTHARYLIGYQNYDSFDFKSAAKNMDLFLLKWKGRYLLDDALWYGGFSHYLTEDFPRAVHLFTRFIEEFPEHKDIDKIVYWRARAFGKINKAAEAKEDFYWVTNNYFGTYYGLAAQVHLENGGEPNFIFIEQLMEEIPWDFLMPFMPVPRLAWAWAQEFGGGEKFEGGAKTALENFSKFGDPKIRRLVGNFQTLYITGEKALAFDEAKYIHDNLMEVPYAEYIAGLMFSLCGENLYATYASNRTAAIIRSGELFDPHRINARRQFPLLYWELIQKVAKRYEMDPYLVIALVKQESAFQITAKSWAGARGLFQIMPGTARWIASKRGIKNFKIADLYKPENSADFGVWYFKRLLDNNNNDIAKALAGYNAGGSRATRWWGENPGRNYDEMIELIGFSETREYVKTILRNWEMYSRLYRDRLEQDTARATVFMLLLEKIPPPPPGM